MLAFDVGVADGIEKTAAGSRAEAAREFAGLALIAAPVAHGMIQRARGKKLTHRQEQVHAASDLAGLGLLAAPYAKALVKRAAAYARPDKEELRRRRRRAIGTAIGGALGSGAGFALPIAGMYARKELGVPMWNVTVPVGTAIGAAAGNFIGGRKKEAAAASPDTTGTSPTTSGELERDVSAPGVSGRSWAQLDTRERAESSGRPPSSGRGVPEWARYLKRMSAVAEEVRP